MDRVTFGARPSNLMIPAVFLLASSLPTWGLPQSSSKPTNTRPRWVHALPANTLQNPADPRNVLETELDDLSPFSKLPQRILDGEIQKIVLDSTTLSLYSRQNKAPERIPMGHQCPEENTFYQWLFFNPVLKNGINSAVEAIVIEDLETLQVLHTLSPSLAIRILPPRHQEHWAKRGYVLLETQTGTRMAVRAPRTPPENKAFYDFLKGLKYGVMDFSQFPALTGGISLLQNYGDQNQIKYAYLYTDRLQLILDQRGQSYTLDWATTADKKAFQEKLLTYLNWQSQFPIGIFPSDVMLRKLLHHPGANFTWSVFEDPRQEEYDFLLNPKGSATTYIYRIFQEEPQKFIDLVNTLDTLGFENTTPQTTEALLRSVTRGY